MSTETDDVVEIQQLLVRHAASVTQADVEGLVAVVTPAGTQPPCFNDHFEPDVRFGDDNGAG